MKELDKYHFHKGNPNQRQFEMYQLADYYKENVLHCAQAHTHSFYQIIWFLNDQGTHSVDFIQHDIEKNRIFFIAKDQVHLFEKRNDYQGYLLHFNESFLLSNELDINFFLTYQIFNNAKTPFYQVSEDLEAVLSGYFQQIILEASNENKFANGEVLSYLLKAMLLVIERELRKQSFSSKHLLEKNGIYLNFRNLLEKNYQKNWSVLGYAEELGVSAKTLNKITKEELDKTVLETINDRIILEAKRKLMHTTVNIKNIAFDLGFNDPYYFVRFFKKKVSITPTQFRKNHS